MKIVAWIRASPALTSDDEKKHAVKVREHPDINNPNANRNGLAQRTWPWRSSSVPACGQMAKLRSVNNVIPNRFFSNDWRLKVIFSEQPHQIERGIAPPAGREYTSLRLGHRETAFLAGAHTSKDRRMGPP
jgi:hypothetical protein